MTHCRALIAEGASASLGKAEKLLDKSAEINEAHHNTYQLIGIRALQAVACARQNKTGEALTFLNLALSLARPGDFLFQFLELGSPMKDLLLQLQERNNSSEFIRKLLAAFGDAEAIPPLPDLRSTNNKRRFESETVAQIQNPKSTRLSSSQAQIPNSLIEPLTHRELDVWSSWPSGCRTRKSPTNCSLHRKPSKHTCTTSTRNSVLANAVRRLRRRKKSGFSE